MKTATPEIRSLVVTAYQTGADRRRLADIFGYHLEIIGGWIRKSRQEHLTPLPRGHRRSGFSALWEGFAEVMRLIGKCLY